MGLLDKLLNNKPKEIEMADIETDESTDWYSQYIVSEHWMTTAKLRRAAGGCIFCGMTNEEHIRKFGKGIDVHHRNHNNRGAERWRDLEIICKPHHQEERLGKRTVPDEPTNPSYESIHADDPPDFPKFPASFGWLTAEKRRMRDEATAKRLNSTPLQLAETIKENYSLTAPAPLLPPPPPGPSPEQIRAQEAEIERLRIRAAQKERLQQLLKQLEEFMEHTGKGRYQSFRDGLRFLKEALISPEDMHTLMRRYTAHGSQYIDALREKDVEIMQVCPTYKPVNRTQLEKKRSEAFGPSKANGKDEPQGESR